MSENITTTKPRMIPCRVFEFEGGCLILAKHKHKGETDEDIADQFGQGKGKLLKSYEQEVSLKYLNSLEDFRDQ